MRIMQVPMRVYVHVHCTRAKTHSENLQNRQYPYGRMHVITEGVDAEPLNILRLDQNFNTEVFSPSITTKGRLQNKKKSIFVPP